MRLTPFLQPHVSRLFARPLVAATTPPISATYASRPLIQCTNVPSRCCILPVRCSSSQASKKKPAKQRVPQLVIKTAHENIQLCEEIRDLSMEVYARMEQGKQDGATQQRERHRQQERFEEQLLDVQEEMEEDRFVVEAVKGQWKREWRNALPSIRALRGSLRRMAGRYRRYMAVLISMQQRTDEELSTVDVEAHAASQVQPEQQPCQQHHQPEPQQQGQQQGQQQVRQQQERQEVEPRLMDYVRVKEGGVCCGSSEEGMPPGTEGVVLGSASKGTRLKMWSLDDPSRCCWYERAQLERVPGGSYLETTNRLVQYFHKTAAERRGVPVTRFTAAPGMLVRDWDESVPRMRTLGHIGVIQPSPFTTGDTCRVAWACGLELTYDTGKDNRFKLRHVEVSPTSGAPVVAGDAWGSEDDEEEHEVQQQGEGTVDGAALQRPVHLLLPSSGLSVGSGVAVERGTHWTYGRVDPGVGILQGEGGSTQLRQRGWLAAQWPNQQPHPYRASPAHGYDLSYSARPGDPVTLFTARQGLRVDLGQDIRGVLDVPLELRGDGVVWSVSVKSGPHVGGRVRYLVARSRSTPLKDISDGSLAAPPPTEEPLRFA